MASVARAEYHSMNEMLRWRHLVVNPVTCRSCALGGESANAGPVARQEEIG